MTKEELALKLHGSQYLDYEAIDANLEEAAENDLVIIFGGSDDIFYCCGAGQSAEESCFNGGIFYFNSNGILLNECDDQNCPYFIRAKANAKIVQAIWGNEISWTYKTEIPHATFDILEDGNVYCRGIVIDLKDLK